MTAQERIKKKYRFDLKTGHYVRLRLNEDEQPNQNPEQNSQNQNNQQQEQQPASPTAVTNIDNEKVIQLRQQMENECASHTDKIKKMTDMLNQLQAQHNAELSKLSKDPNTDPKTADSILKQMIQCRKQITDAEFEKARITHDYTLKICSEQNAILESMYKLPGKYAILNESNIHSAKVYITSLVGNDDYHIMKGMVDVKRVFRASQLFHGKDKDGYFVLCIDQEDFDRLYKALQETGYSREQIIDAIMPQVFDRRELVK